MFYGEKTERLNYIFSMTLCLIKFSLETSQPTLKVK